MDNKELVMLQNLPLDIKIDREGKLVHGNVGLGIGKILDIMGGEYKPH